MNKRLFSFLFIALCFNLQSQNYADKSFYLTDSLDLYSISKSDSQLVFSSLAWYHKAENDSLKIEHLANITLLCYSDDVMNIYNEILKEKMFGF